MEYVLDLLRKDIKIIEINLPIAEKKRMPRDLIQEKKRQLHALYASLELLEKTHELSLGMERDLLEGTSDIQPKGLAAFEEDFKA